MISATSKPLVQQVIDQRASSGPGGQVVQWETQRNVVLAGPVQGLDTFTSYEDAVTAASKLSGAHNPGLAVMQWRSGFRLHDVRSASQTYRMTSSHGPLPPMTVTTGKSNVPWAVGNVRAEGNGNGPAQVHDAKLMALVDGRYLLEVPRSAAATDGAGLIAREL